MLVNSLFTSKDWHVSALIRESIFDYLLWEWEESNSSFNILRLWVGGLAYYNQRSAAEKFRLVVDNATERKLYEEVPDIHHNYLEADKKKRENDLRFIKSIDSFRVGIRLFFDAYGKGEIPENELYIDFEDKAVRKNSDSNFVYRLLSFWAAEKKKVSLSKALKILDTYENFEFFRAYEISYYNLNNSSNSKVY